MGRRKEKKKELPENALVRVQRDPKKGEEGIGLRSKRKKGIRKV